MTRADEDDKLRAYLGDDGSIGSVILDRGKALIKMREEHFKKIQELQTIQDQELNDFDLWQRSILDPNAPTHVYGQNHTIWDSWDTITQQIT
jgi:hypothetical protein